MLNGLVEIVLNVFFAIAGLISSIIISPILLLLEPLFPNLDSYLDIAMSFFGRFCNGVAFAKEVFLNITGYPRALFVILVTYIFARLAFMVSKRVFLFIYNMYSVVRGTKGGSEE